MSDKNIFNELVKTFYSELIFCLASLDSYLSYSEISNVDDFLDLKWKIFSSIIENNISTIEGNLGSKAINNFFRKPQNKEKIIKKIKLILFNTEVVNRFFRGLVKNDLINIKKENDKIDLTHLVDLLKSKNTAGDENENKNVKLTADDSFVKLCKGIYRLSRDACADTEDTDKLLSYDDLGNFLLCFFIEGQEDDIEYVFNSIDKIECEDDEFKAIQERLKGFSVKSVAECKLRFVKNQTEIVNSNGLANSFYEFKVPVPNDKFQDEDGQGQFSFRKISLLVTTVIAFGISVMFGFNAQLAFIAFVTNFWSIIIAAAALVLFLVLLVVACKTGAFKVGELFSCGEYAKESWLDLDPNNNRNNEPGKYKFNELDEDI